MLEWRFYDLDVADLAPSGPVFIDRFRAALVQHNAIECQLDVTASRYHIKRVFCGVVLDKIFYRPAFTSKQRAASGWYG
jgi:hypothetical protein